MTTAQLTITLLLTAFFMFASSIKITGWQKQVFTIQLEFFKKYGLNRTVMLLVGLVELTGALLLISPVLLQTVALWVPQLGALTIAATSLGAIFFHLRFDTFRDGIPAFVTLCLSVTLLLLSV